jgi:transposase
MDRGSLELLLGQGLSIEKIAERFGKHPSTVSYWLAKHGLKAVNREKHAARGGIERERLEALVEAGMTIAQIARECGVSNATVRHWLGRHGLRTRNASNVSAGRGVRAAKEAGLLTARMSCARHGEAEFVLEDAVITGASAAGPRRSCEGAAR